MVATAAVSPYLPCIPAHGSFSPVSKWRVSHAQVEVILSIKKSGETSGHIQNGKLAQGLISIFVGYYFLDKTEALVHFF